jgi:hypothetical protein
MNPNEPIRFISPYFHKPSTVPTDLTCPKFNGSVTWTAPDTCMYSLPCSSSEVMLLRYSAESRLSHTCTLQKFMGDLNFMGSERDLMGTKWDV